MQGINTTFDDACFDRDQDSRRFFLLIGPGVAVVAALSVWIGAWIKHAPQAAAPAIVAPRAAAPTGARPATVAANPYGDIFFDPGFISTSKRTWPTRAFSLQANLEPLSPARPTVVARLETVPDAPTTAPQPQSVPLPPRREVDQIDESAPLPPPRPVEFGLPAQPAAAPAPQSSRTARAAAPPDNRNIFEKLLGLGPQPAGAAAVAYATPESRLQGGKMAFAPLAAPSFASSNLPQGYDRWTAVYDISARTVYLPDGTRLEAHSGMGEKMDNPRYVSERMQGATPPHLYELELREASFHGVEALRLKPIGGGDLFGRAGLLAHSYMLGPNGDSNGCVSFKDYEAFLRAYQNGQIKRLAVVSRL